MNYSISVVEVARAAYPSMEPAVIAGFIKGFSRERESVWWNSESWKPMKATIVSHLPLFKDS